MSGLLDTLGQTFGAVLGHPLVGLAVRFTLVYLTVLWLASAWWVWRDARARWRDPLVPYVAAAGIVLVTPALFPLAAIVYRVLRPSITVAQADAAELQLAMLEEEAARSACARCGAPVEEDWVACPTCGSELAVRCATCGRPLELDWTICAWCAAEVPWAEGSAGLAAIAEPVQRDPVAIPIRPGGRPLVPVVALPEETVAGGANGATRRRARPRRRED